MGLFNSFFRRKSKDNGPENFVSAAEFRENLALQTKMSPQTLIELRKHGVNDDTNLKLEFFFYTDTQPKAQALLIRLKSMGYEVRTEPSSDDADKLLITGWTTPQDMSENAIITWTQKMCHLGYEWDCEFDGWGTYPGQ
jgi:regulator of RNase E activity RraB